MKTYLYTVAFVVTARIEIGNDGEDDAELPLDLKEYDIISMSVPDLIDVETLTIHDRD
jgi:hypothetical protein